MGSILYWNAVALEANRISHTKKPMEQAGPTLSARALAIVHLAMYDAYGGFVPFAQGSYLTTPPTPPALPTGVTPVQAAEAAVAGAAMTTLSALFKTQKDFFQEKLLEFGGGWSAGFAYGVAVAEAVLKARENDPDASDAGYAPSKAPGRHRPDPDNARQGFYAPFYGAGTRLFATKSRFRLAPPPFLKGSTYDPDYVAAARQVRSKGIAPELMGTLPTPAHRRTALETLIGLYWGYDGAAGLGTPPRLYNQIVRLVVEQKKATTDADHARLFALVNAAMADAGILAWENKYDHDFWRPVVGLREYDTSMGPATTTPGQNLSDDQDAGWLPLGAPASNALNAEYATKVHGPYPCNESNPGVVKNFTPNFPAYPSGHATFGAAALHSTRLFFKVPAGDRQADDLLKKVGFVSEEFNGKTQDNRGTVRPNHLRGFKGGLWDMIIENGASRVYLGVHWSFDAFAGSLDKPDLDENIGGVRLGLDIAEAIEKDGLKQSVGAPPRIA